VAPVGPGDKGIESGISNGIKDISARTRRFLEMLDVLNEKLILDGDDPSPSTTIAREGICGMCGMMINGVAHGPQRPPTTCQLHMPALQGSDV